MNPASESYDPGMPLENLEAAQPFDLKESLQIRDGLVRPKPIEEPILQFIQAHLNRGICFNWSFICPAVNLVDLNFSTHPNDLSNIL